MMATRWTRDTLQQTRSPLSITRSDEDLPRVAYDEDDDSLVIEATARDPRLVLDSDPDASGDDPTALHNRAVEPLLAYARAVTAESVSASQPMRRAAYYLVQAYQAAHEDDRPLALRALVKAHKYYGIAKATAGERWPAELRTLSERVIERLS